MPHVESSFNPAAYSKVGAAGLWQFMPSTAKRFMRVDSLVDERLDPYSATEAAANLMLYNYRLLGTWPLAVTAYNHGPGGLRRAQEQLGTSDIAVIVKRYQGATFGFASRNFYVSFLAALEVDRNAEKYFGPITPLPDTQNTPVELPDYIAVDAAGESLQSRHGSAEGLESGVAPADLERGAIGAPRLCAAHPGAARRIPRSPRRGRACRRPTLPGSAQRRQPSGAPRRDAGRHRGGKRRRAWRGCWRRTAGAGPMRSTRGEVVRIPMPPSRAEVGGAAAVAGVSVVHAPIAPAPAGPARAPDVSLASGAAGDGAHAPRHRRGGAQGTGLARDKLTARPCCPPARRPEFPM